MESNPPFVSIEVILNGLKSEELSQYYKEKIENTVQYDTFMRKCCLKSYSSVGCCCCCCCFKPVCGVCRKKAKPNMYQILGLDMKQEFKKNIGQQNKNIKQAFENSIKKYDPGKNAKHGNQLIVGKIQEANKVLENPKKRVEYVNKYEHKRSCCFWSYYACCDCGCSCDYLRSLFFPLQAPQETFQDSDKIWRETQYCRIVMLIISFLFYIGGTTLTIFVFGPGIRTTPQGIYSGAFLGGALAVAGYFGGSRNLNEKDFKLKDWVISSVLGMLFGGISEIISWTLFEKVHLSNLSPVLEEMIVGVITGITGGFLSWVGNVSENTYFSRETLTLKSLGVFFVCSLVVGILLGGISGCISALVKRKLTQDTSIDEFTLVSWLKRCILKTHPERVRNLLQATDFGASRAVAGMQSSNDLSSDSVQSVHKCC